MEPASIVSRVLLIVSHYGAVDQADMCVERGFHQMGCAVQTFDYQATALAPRLLRRIIPRALRHRWSPRQLPAVARADTALTNRRFVEAIHRVRPQLVVALRAERLNAAAIQAARAQGAITINWIGDEPWRFNPPETIPAYDLWAVCDRTWAAWLQQHGARRVEHLPMACDPELHAPLQLSEAERHRWRSALCFVGGFTPGREQWLTALTDLGLSIWGPGWERATDPAVRRCVREARMLRRQEWLMAYAAADVVINIQSQGQEGLSMRVWESLAAGVCLVADEKADLERFLAGVVTTFHTAEEFRSRCEALLADAATRHRLAQEGRARVLAQHTFAHRAATLLQWARELREVGTTGPQQPRT